MPCLLAHIFLKTNRRAKPPNVAALDPKASSVATNRSTPTAPMGMSSSATLKQAIPATTASGSRASNAENSLAEVGLQYGGVCGLNKYLECTYVQVELEIESVMLKNQ